MEWVGGVNKEPRALDQGLVSKPGQHLVDTGPGVHHDKLEEDENIP